MKHIFRTMRYRNYRLFFGGQLVSLVGTMMQQLGMSWYVYDLTGSSFWLGIVVFCNQAPSVIVTPMAGVLADRFNRRNLLVLTQFSAMLQALLLAALVLTGNAGITVILILSLAAGVINAIDAPVRQSFVIDMVEKREDLGNAIALNSAMFNTARFIGPSIGGLLVPIFGEGMCFLINGISYSAVIMALLAMRLPAREMCPVTTGVRANLRDGFRYAFHSPLIRYLMILVSLFSLFGTSYMVLLPVVARDVLGGGADTLGLLMASAGVGAVIGAFYLAWRRTVRGLWRVVALTTVLISLSLIGAGFSRSFVQVVPLLSLLGFGLICLFGACNTLLQTIVENDKRGRVMSLYALAFLGFTPLGSFFSGWAAGIIGVGYTFLLCGALCLISSLALVYRLRALRDEITQVYLALGIPGQGGA